jgi:hypothetical protein|tara:strand:+ start:425 stop:643 length:219 start_codon:yes stop_codon:yes gene_type:complete
VIKPKYTVDPFDILKGAGDFRYTSKEDMLKKWSMINATNYELTLMQPKAETDSAIVKLEKKKIEADEKTKTK